jgi:hypothetical protein
VKPMQEAMMTQVQKQMEQSIKSMDPETMLKTWLPASLEGFEQLQKLFWGQMNPLGTKGPGTK